MAVISRNYSLYFVQLAYSFLNYHAKLQNFLNVCRSAILTMKPSRKLSKSGWRDREKISILVELTVCQKKMTQMH